MVIILYGRIVACGLSILFLLGVLFRVIVLVGDSVLYRIAVLSGLRRMIVWKILFLSCRLSDPSVVFRLGELLRLDIVKLSSLHRMPIEISLSEILWPSVLFRLCPLVGSLMALGVGKMFLLTLTVSGLSRVAMMAGLLEPFRSPVVFCLLVVKLGRWRTDQ